jgi:hypothetical protein
MGRLDRLPTEILYAILDELPITDVRNLRLVNRSVNAVASSVAFQEICFITRKDDLDMVRIIASNPGYAAHITSLAYVVHMFNAIRQTFVMFTEAIRRQERMEAELHNHRPQLFNRPKPIMNDTEVQDLYHRYVRLYEEQTQILSNNHDFALLEEVVPKLANLKSIVVSDCNELRTIYKNRPIPKRDITDFYSGEWDDGAASARHLRVLLKAVETAGTQLQSIQAGLLHIDILDDTQFGLHSMAPHLLENLTTLRLMLVAAEEQQYSGMRVGDEAALHVHVRSQLAACRAMTEKGTLRRTLDKMPNLVNLSIELAEFHMLPYGTHACPAYLKDIIPLDRVWPKLKRLLITHVETERQELITFLVRHKASLESFDLGFIRLTTTSWLKLLPDLKAQFRNGGRLKTPRITNDVLGRSEDDGLPEGWYLGHPDHDRPLHPLGKAVTKYLVSNRKKSCPLHDENMLDRIYDALDATPSSDDLGSVWSDAESEVSHGDGTGATPAITNTLGAQHFGVGPQHAEDLDDLDEEDGEEEDDIEDSEVEDDSDSSSGGSSKRES